MATPHKQKLLQKLCNQDETYELAQKLLVVAQAKTGPGSGHELGDRAVCLPAVCAYIASQRLRNNDVKKGAAQSSVCANPKVFTQAVDIVRSALDETEGKEGRRASRRKLTYDSLINRYKLGRRQTLLDWMMDTEAEFAESYTRYEAGNSDITCAVFYWVCKKSQVRRDDMDSLAEEHGISQTIFGNLLKALDKACVTQGARIIDHVTKLRKQSNAKASSSSPSKSTLPKRAQNSSPLKKRKATSNRSDTEDQDDDDDDDMSLLPKTPTKKQKVNPPSKLSIRSSTKPPVESTPSTSASAEESDTSLAETPDEESSPAHTPAISLSNPGPPTRYRVSDQNRHHSDAMDVDYEPEVEDNEPRLPKRFRPVFLDYKQWYQRDPRIEQEWKEAEKHKGNMLTLYPHPFEKYRPAQMEVEDS